MTLDELKADIAARVGRWGFKFWPATVYHPEFMLEGRPLPLLFLHATRDIVIPHATGAEAGRDWPREKWLEALLWALDQWPTDDAAYFHVMLVKNALEGEYKVSVPL